MSHISVRPLNTDESELLESLFSLSISGPNEGIYKATSTTFGNRTFGSGGGGTWGSITGLLSDQLDLQIALNDKADVGQTFYIGTTQVAINRASAALTLAGLTLTTPDIGVAIGTSLGLVGGTLGSTLNVFSASATLSSTNAVQTAINLSITGAGSGASATQSGILLTFNAGYTGAALTQGIATTNLNAGTGNDFVAGAYNVGVFGQARGTTTGDNVGLQGLARGGDVNIGQNGRAIIAKNGATNIGVVGVALNTGSTPVQIGGYFGLHSTKPTFGASAALMTDNGGTTSDIFVARDNGSSVFTIADGGAVTINGTLKILEGGGTPTKYTIFQGGDQAIDLTYTLPTAYPAVTGYVLSATDAGVMSWIAAGGSITGSDTQLLFFDGANNPAGDAGFTYNKTSNIATLGGLVTADIHTVSANSATDIVIDLGNAISGDNLGGSFSVFSGNGFGTEGAGEVTLQGGEGGDTGVGGAARLLGGSGGVTSGGGGGVTLTAGSAQAGDSNGGTMRISAGNKSGAGNQGQFAIKSGGPSEFALLNTILIADTDKTFTFPNVTSTFAVTSGHARATAQTAANTNVLTVTVGDADATLQLLANVLVTTATTHNFTVTVDYTDESNVARTVTIPFAQLAGTIITAITNITGVGPYEGVPLTIRAKAATTVVFKTAGVFTSVAYNVDCSVIQVATT